LQSLREKRRTRARAPRHQAQARRTPGRSGCERARREEALAKTSAALQCPCERTINAERCRAGR
jgi:hypothetical protein